MPNTDTSLIKENAAFLHHRFVEIHPFIDGNGRAARLLTNQYLIAHGFIAKVNYEPPA
jgi:Fic family protein